MEAPRRQTRHRLKSLLKRKMHKVERRQKPSRALTPAPPAPPLPPVEVDQPSADQIAVQQ